MEKVAECVGKVPEIYGAYAAGDEERVRELAALISKLEHEADLVKRDIRNSLPRGLFMPVDRSNLLTILAMQDDLADKAENFAVLLTLKQVEAPEPFAGMFQAFLAKNLEAFENVQAVIGQLDELLETGFGGAEAENVKELVDNVALKEHEADVLQRDLMRELLQHDDAMGYADFYLWTRLIRQVAGISNRAENLANSVRSTLEK
jgi:predicted phosphate transport protein (TIGR00153 family)